MKKIFYLPSLVFFLFFFHSNFTHAQETPIPEEKYRMVIKVMSADRKEPIEGATIWIETKTFNDRKRERADWDGMAYREYNVVGTFTISAEASGFYGSKQVLVIPPNALPGDFPVTLLLKRRANVKLVVVTVDEAGVGPINDAQIQLKGGLYRFSGSTNSDGQAVIMVDQGGDYALTVTHKGYESTKGSVRVKLYDDQKEYPLKFSMTALKQNPPKPLHVYVKDKNNKAVPEAAVVVIPGISGVTNASGYAKAWHKQLRAEYIDVQVSAKGYKDQQQRVLVGVRQGTTQYEDEVRFIMEKGENDRNVRHLMIEVLDGESFQPVTGAVVKVELSDATSFSGNSDNKGEAKFTDMDLGFEGTTAKVIVTKKGYTEKWSDIPADLMTAKDMEVRKFVVYISKACVESVTGKFKIGGDPSGLMILTHSGPTVTGRYGKDENSLVNTLTGTMNCNELKGTFTNTQYKTSGKFTYTFSTDGKSYTGTWRNDVGGKSGSSSGSQ